jgi:Skp family chaperone for outer membrane proteins
MKKLLLVCVTVAASLLFSSNAQAQAKIGYFDDQSVLSLFPNINKVDSLLASYVKDSLNVEYAYTIKEYQRRDSLFKKDSAGMPAKARQMATDELGSLYYKLSNWQNYAQQMQEGKLDELLMPYRQKIAVALQDVVKEGKYTIILKSEALVSPYYFQPSILDNLTIRVAMKLKLDLPKEVLDAWKAAGGTLPGGGTTPANKPAPKG